MNTEDVSPAFRAGNRLVSLAAEFLKHVHEGDEAGMRSILEEVNSSGLVSEFVAALAAIAVGFARHLYGVEELGQAREDYAVRLRRESFHDHLPDSS